MTVTESELAPLEVSFVDDPRVVDEAKNEDYTTHVVPLSWRLSTRSLSMSWYAVVSGMFYLVTAASLAAIVGTRNAVIGIILACFAFSAIGYVASRYATRTGLTVALMSQRIFGSKGSMIAPLILGATAIYYATFEGSVIASAFRAYFGGLPIQIWYAIAVAMNLPLVIGGIRRWMDKYNMVLLPLYGGGLIIAVVIAAGRTNTSGWFSQGPAHATLDAPGWLYAFFLYLGVLVFIMYTVDFARFGRAKESRKNGVLIFGPLFYVLVYLANGLIGIFLAYAAGLSGDVSSSAVVNYMIAIMGGWGLALVWVTQARINTANYYVASTNIEALFTRLFNCALPRVYAVLISGAFAYLFMLTNVLNYLNTALSWQGAFIASWVGILLVHVYLSRDDDNAGEFRSGRLRRFTIGAWIWLVVSVCAVVAYEFAGTVGATWSTPASLIAGALLYAAAYPYQTRTIMLPRLTDPRREVDDEWEARIRCHVCDRSYVAREMDRDPSLPGSPTICVACGCLSRAYQSACRREAETRPK